MSRVFVETMFGHMDQKDRNIVASLLRDAGERIVREALDVDRSIEPENYAYYEDVSYARRREKQYGEIASWFLEE